MELFSSDETRSYFSKRSEALENEVARLSDSEILSCDFDEWIEYLQNKYEIAPIVLFEENTTQNISETKVKQYNPFFRSDPYEPQYYQIDGVSISYTIPYDGDPKLFQLKPSSRILTRFSVERFLEPCKNDCGSITLCLEFTKQELQGKGAEMQTAVSTKFHNTFENYKTMIGYVNAEVASFNSSLANFAGKCLKERKDKASSFAEISKILEIPLHQNANAPNVTPVQLSRVSRVPAQKPKTKPKPTEYMIRDADYENINNIIMMFGTTMEQTARTYYRNDEEELRDHLLAALNTHYDNATGETFRKIGKTDIHISFENKAAFIGECKIWRGEKVFADAIQQVMNYSTWKDNKVSVIIFNKHNQSFQQIISKISDWVESNTKSYRRLKANSWDCIFYRVDMQVDVRLNIVAFDLYVDEKQFKDSRTH